MGEDTTRNMKSRFPDINTLCNVASCWKYIKRNILTMHGPLNVKKKKIHACSFTNHCQRDKNTGWCAENAFLANLCPRHFRPTSAKFGVPQRTFKKVSSTKFHGTPPTASSAYWCGRIDRRNMVDLIGDFREYAWPPKKSVTIAPSQGETQTTCSQKIFCSFDVSLTASVV